jgi:polysaccharide pyruvyl transferase WcaK-like protein
MKIIVDNSAYGLRNLGDIAMLQVAVNRLHQLWPGALIQVITDAPDLLTTYCPNAQALPARSRPLVGIANQRLFEAVWNRLPSRTSKVFNRLDAMVQLSNPSWHRAISEADLLIASGGGYINDVFPGKAFNTLSLLEMAIRNGKPTAMFGMGIGPIRTRKLLAKAKAVLPQVDLIALRENLIGLPFLESIGVAPRRVVTTGDDAIHLALENGSAEVGDGIGVNLRIATYSKVGRSVVEAIRPILQEASDRHHAPLVPLPILIRGRESDIETIQRLLTRNEERLDKWLTPASPIELLEQLRRCRVVVTGSYHAGVFALAQGIPIVGLAKSEYYIDKFRGLADQFKYSCQVIYLDDNHFHVNLSDAIDTAWRAAGRYRDQLLKLSKEQSESSGAAYHRLYDLVESRKAVGGRR